MSLDDNIDKVAAAIYFADNGGSYHAFVNNYGISHVVTQRYRKLAVAAMNEELEWDVETDSHEIRTLRWKVKTLGRQLGKSGERIHQLRTEAEYRRAIAMVDPRGYSANLERLRAAETRVNELLTHIKELENPGTQLTEQEIADGFVHVDPSDGP